MTTLPCLSEAVMIMFSFLDKSLNASLCLLDKARLSELTLVVGASSSYKKSFLKIGIIASIV